MARQVLPVVGAVVGAYFGNPQLGWAIGSAIGNAVDPQVLPGPRIGEIAAQTSQEGGPRPIVFALSPPIAGNIIYSAEPRIVRRKKSQGKGGPKVETESVYRTYAVGVCEGPITGFVRVWRNGILVYDVSDNPLLSAAENNKFLETARFFLGSYSQTASPDVQAIVGSNAPAHRGTAYLVMADEDLTDLRGMVPQFQFQVLRCEGYDLTSRPYPIEGIEGLDSAGALIGGSLVVPPGPTIHTVEFAEALDSSGDLRSGALRDPLQTASSTEALDSSGDLASAVLRTVILEYADEPHALDSAGDVVSGALRVVIIEYDRDPHALDSSGDLIGGSLT